MITKKFPTRKKMKEKTRELLFAFVSGGLFICGILLLYNGAKYGLFYRISGFVFMFGFAFALIKSNLIKSFEDVTKK